MNHQSEQDRLLDSAQSGDPEALEALLKAVQPQIYRFSMKMCRHSEDAEDVLQDSLMALARSLKDFRGASSFSTWLFTITRSFCIKKRRKSKFAPVIEESLEGMSAGDQSALKDGGVSPHDALESSEIWRQVHGAIQRLEPDHREIIALRDIEGLKAKEVAEVIGITVSAVKSRLHRARAELRQQLTKGRFKPRQGCPDIRRVFSEYLEGDLSPEICSTMESHVESCSFCAAECEGLKQALVACSTAPGELPDGVQERVQLAIRQLAKGL